MESDIIRAMNAEPVKAASPVFAETAQAPRKRAASDAAAVLRSGVSVDFADDIASASLGPMTEDPDLTEIHIDLPNHWWFKGQSLWTKRLGNDLYEIQNVPFCAYDLNCGDVVLATADDPDSKPEIRSVVRRSGNQTLRVSFNVEKDEQRPFLQVIESNGAWVERARPDFICINVPPGANFEGLRAYLSEQEAAGALEYETCEARVAGSFDDSPEDESDEA